LRIPRTVSIGVSSVAALSVALGVDALLESADRCLYSSKDFGRNCITVAAAPCSTSVG
jgi:PleD family two-component response regulator